MKKVTAKIILFYTLQLSFVAVISHFFIHFLISDFLDIGIEKMYFIENIVVILFAVIGLKIILDKNKFKIYSLT